MSALFYTLDVEDLGDGTVRASLVDYDFQSDPNSHVIEQAFDAAATLSSYLRWGQAFDLGDGWVECDRSLVPTLKVIVKRLNEGVAR